MNKWWKIWSPWISLTHRFLKWPCKFPPPFRKKIQPTVNLSLKSELTGFRRAESSCFTPPWVLKLMRHSRKKPRIMEALNITIRQGDKAPILYVALNGNTWAYLQWIRVCNQEEKWHCCRSTVRGLGLNRRADRYWTQTFPLIWVQSSRRKVLLCLTCADLRSDSRGSVRARSGKNPFCRILVEVELKNRMKL